MLSFPSNPTTGQTSVQNGRTYIYAGNNAWRLVPASGGSGSLSGSVTIPASGDEYWDNVSLLLRMNGIGNNFADFSSAPKSIAVVGNCTQSSTQSKWGGKSMYLDGSGDYLTIPSSAAFGFGTGDFTVEYWWYPTRNSGDETMIDTRADNTADPIVLGKSAAGEVRCFDGSSVRVGGTMNLNAWNHVAWSRSGTDNSLYLNGARVIQFANAFNGGTARGLTIGSNVVSQYENSQGYVDDIRITLAARYSGATITVPTAAFGAGTYTAPQTLPVTVTGSGGGGSGLTWSSVPASPTATGTAGSIAYDGATGFFYVATAANTWRRAALSTWLYDPLGTSVSLLLHMDGVNGSTTFSDSSGVPKTITAVGNASVTTSQYKFGTGSATFDGAGDCLTIPTSSAFDFGSGEFTVEFWCRRSGAQAYSGLVSLRSSSGLAIGFGNGDNNLRIVWGNAEQITPQSSQLTDGVWTHVALVRSGNTVTLYKDGASIGTQTLSGAMPFDNTGLAIGRLISNDVGYEFSGQIDELRITKAARYSGAFAVPTAAFPDAS